MWIQYLSLVSVHGKFLECGKCVIKRITSCVYFQRGRPVALSRRLYVPRVIMELPCMGTFVWELSSSNFSSHHYALLNHHGYLCLVHAPHWAQHVCVCVCVCVGCACTSFLGSWACNCFQWSCVLVNNCR